MLAKNGRWRKPPTVRPTGKKHEYPLTSRLLVAGCPRVHPGVPAPSVRTPTARKAGRTVAEPAIEPPAEPEAFPTSVPALCLVGDRRAPRLRIPVMLSSIRCPACLQCRHHVRLVNPPPYKPCCQSPSVRPRYMPICCSIQRQNPNQGEFGVRPGLGFSGTVGGDIPPFATPGRNQKAGLALIPFCGLTPSPSGLTPSPSSPPDPIPSLTH